MTDNTEEKTEVTSSATSAVANPPNPLTEEQRTNAINRLVDRLRVVCEEEIDQILESIKPGSVDGSDPIDRALQDAIVEVAIEAAVRVTTTLQVVCGRGDLAMAVAHYITTYQVALEGLERVNQAQTLEIFRGMVTDEKLRKAHEGGDLPQT